MAGRTISRPRPEKSQRYVFFLGVLLAAVAAIIVFIAVSAAGSGSGAGDIAVVVAKQSIPAQTRITTDMIEVQFKPSDEAVADAFSSRSQLVDRVATQDIEKDNQILPSMVTDIAGDGVAFKVDPGMRAVSVEVKDVVTVGGNVQPGDRVDVVGIFQVQDVQAANDLLAQLGMTQKVVAPTLPAGGEVVGGGSGLYLTLTMLQNVKLLGVDQALTETTAGGDLADSVDKSNSDNSEPGASTATLELTPKQAQDISWADQFGVLRFTGRPAGESSVDAVAPTLVRVDQTR